ncbi:hypothetical protein PGDDIFCJ_00098 [Thermus phage YS40_Isch]|nr:hypothetical protein PGDDIFCJ_00098 [Thermus phage YS40_Isch]
MVEKELQAKIMEEVKAYLKKWGIPDDVNIGGNVKYGEDAISVRAFVEAPLKRIFVEYAGASLRGLPRGYNGWANFYIAKKGDKNVYIYLDDGLVLSDFDGKKVIIEIVPLQNVLPVFRRIE